MTAVQYAIADTLVLAKRSLKRIPRQPDLLVGFTIQPIMFVLLFVYVFGGAIDTGDLDYVDFLIPGIIVQSMVFGGFVTALGLSEDLEERPDRPLPFAADVGAGRDRRSDPRRRRDERDPARDHVRGRDHRRLPLRDELPGDRGRHGAPAADRLCVLVGVRVHGAVGVVARGRQRLRLHDPSRSRSSRPRSCRWTPCRTGCNRSRNTTRSRPWSTPPAPSSSGPWPATTSGSRWPGRSRSSPSSACCRCGAIAARSAASEFA